MKKIMMVLISVLALVSIGASQQPNPKTYYGCIQTPYSKCAQFGNPWQPNYPNLMKANGIDCMTNAEAIVKLQEIIPNTFGDAKEKLKSDLALALSGDPSACAVNSSYDPSKPTYDPIKWKACADPIYADCKVKFGR